MNELTCFKAYDISEIGVNIDEAIAIGLGGLWRHCDAKSVIIGFDARETALLLPHLLCKGCAMLAGCDQYWYGWYGRNVLGGRIWRLCWNRSPHLTIR